MPSGDGAVERALRSFAAAMLAEIAHELNNRLATMRETLGLLEDLARAGRTGASATARAQASLDGQVGRMLNIARAIGALGGALGPGTGAFDVGAALDDLLATTERWARRFSLRIERDLPSGLPRGAGDPAIFLCLLHRLLLRRAAGSGGGGELLVRVRREGEMLALRLASAAAGAAGTAPGVEEERVDRELAARLGAGLTFEEDGAVTLRLVAVR